MDAMGRVAVAACASAAASSAAAAPPGSTYGSSKRGRGHDDDGSGPSGGSSGGRGGGSGPGSGSGSGSDFDDLLSSLTHSLGSLTTKEPTKEELVSTFTQVLDIAPSEALFMLTSANYDLATAVSLYLESQESDAPSASRRRRVGPAQDRQIEIKGLAAGWMAFVCSTRHTVVSTLGGRTLVSTRGFPIPTLADMAHDVTHDFTRAI